MACITNKATHALTCKGIQSFCWSPHAVQFQTPCAAKQKPTKVIRMHCNCATGDSVIQLALDHSKVTVVLKEFNSCYVRLASRMERNV